MKSELDEYNKRDKELRAALLSSRETMDSLLKFTAASHPMLAYRLRCMRVTCETSKVRKVMARLEKEEEELKHLRSQNKELKIEVKKLKASAEKFINENARGSLRGVAAENVVLKSKLILSKKYIKKRST